MKKAFALLVLTGAVAGCASLQGEQSKPAAGATATAQVEPTTGNKASGTVTFTQQGDKVRVVAEISGLKPNAQHGFHIHEKGDCSAADGTSAGGHFNPAGAKHGHYAHKTSHAGDMPNLKADASGKATFSHDLEGVTLADGATSIVNRAVVVHAGPDDYASQPAGNSGARIGCGVITKG